jgi:hypothetical protein
MACGCSKDVKRDIGSLRTVKAITEFIVVSNGEKKEERIEVIQEPQKEPKTVIKFM